MDFLSNGIISILMLLPECPFAAIFDYFEYEIDGWANNFLDIVNLFVPIFAWVGILETWIVAVGVYYLYQVVLRWLNVVE